MTKEKRRYVKLLVISKVCLIFAMMLLALISFGPQIGISIERIYVLTIIVPIIIILLIPIMIYWILPKEN